jgi:hypothetical protein
MLYVCLADLQVPLEGQKWKQSCVDVCIAGVGWVGIGLNGVARLMVWRQPKIAITSREALIPDFAEKFESPGWSANTKAIFGTRDATGKKLMKKPKRSKRPSHVHGATEAKIVGNGGAKALKNTRQAQSRQNSDKGRGSVALGSGPAKHVPRVVGQV